MNPENNRAPDADNTRGNSGRAGTSKIPQIGAIECRRIAAGFEDLARRCGVDLDAIADHLVDYFGSDSAREVFTCWLSLTEDARTSLIARFRAGDR